MQRIADHDTSSDLPLSPRSLINSSYWASSHREPNEREEMLLDEVLKSVTGDDGYPGDSTPSAKLARRGPRHARHHERALAEILQLGGIVDVSPKPPILWTHGTADIGIADGSAWEMGTLGKMGTVPGWPGEDVFPPQPMVTHIRNVLSEYHARGGRVDMEMFEGSGHGPLMDAADRWSRLFFEFLALVEVPAAV